MRKRLFDNPMDLQFFAMSEEELQAKLQELFGAEQNNNEANNTDANLPEINLSETQLTDETNQQTIPTDEIPQNTGDNQQQTANMPPEQTVEQPQEGSTQSSVIEKLKQAGVTKFTNEDDFIKSYIELEKMNTRTRQELSDLRNQVSQLMQVIQQQQQTTQPAAQPQQEELDSETFLELFYEDPKRAIKQIFMDVIKPEIEPYIEKIKAMEEEKTWRQMVDEFAAEHPDLEQWAQQIGEVLLDNPELRTHPKGLEIAYYFVKGRNYTPVNPDDFLNDEQFINEKILKNENIRKRIIEDYLQSIKNGNPPVTIGKPAGNNIAATLPKKPQNLEEATEMALKLFTKG